MAQKLSAQNKYFLKVNLYNNKHKYLAKKQLFSLKYKGNKYFQMNK